MKTGFEERQGKRGQGVSVTGARRNVQSGRSS